MKAPINEETKAAFWSQYYKQPVFSCGSAHLISNKVVVDGWVIDNFINTGFVNLRYISSLTDEEKQHISLIPAVPKSIDAIDEFVDALVYNHPISEIDMYYTCRSGELKQIFDYIIERSILLPFRGIPCEEILQAGWAVIRKEETI